MKASAKRRLFFADYFMQIHVIDAMRLSAFLSFVMCISAGLFSQNKLTVNGQPITSDCAKVMEVDRLDTIAFERVKIYHAEINNNCLELGVTCGDCEANLELVTDNQLEENHALKLHFLLRYSEGSKPCNSALKTKLYFDLLPYKNIRTGRFIIISLMGEKFNLSYNRN